MVKKGNSHSMKFELVDDNGDLVVVPSWYLSIYDIDGKPNPNANRERFFAKGFSNFFV